MGHSPIIQVVTIHNTGKPRVIVLYTGRSESSSSELKTKEPEQHIKCATKENVAVIRSKVRKNNVTKNSNTIAFLYWA